MKKSLSLILSALMTASAMTACAPARDRLDPAITLASSDANAKAAWLDERLDVIPDDVVLGVGSNSAYGIDMTDFEDDGYIARAMDGEVLLFGKTADGLDRAVREYAKSADKGATAELDTVYHEGVRVEKLTIGGHDISEFTVVYNHDRNTQAFGKIGKTIGNAGYAADELIRLVEKATGVKLQKSAEDVSGPMIKIDYVTDDSCGENGFNYKVENGNLYINGAPDANGCANGVYYFLQYECGWVNLMYGDSDLQESDCVTVEDGVAKFVDPLYDYMDFYGMFMYHFKNERSQMSQNYCGIIQEAHHGMDAHKWSGRALGLFSQICHTNESVYQSVFDAVYTYVDRAVDSGALIGETLTTIDIAQADNYYYCLCGSCAKVYKAEGRAHSGAVVRFANRLAEDMEREDFGGLVYAIYAYHGSNVPPVTEARDDIYVTFCTDGACTNHPLRGGCGDNYSMDVGSWMTPSKYNNDTIAEWIKGWGEKCKNVYVWHYALSDNYGSYTYYSNLYDDFHYMSEMGVSGIFLNFDYTGLGFGRIRFEIISAVIWNPDLSEEEFNLLLDEILYHEYGEGYEYVKDFIEILERTEYDGACWNCWGYGNRFNQSQWDIEMFYESAEDCFKLLCAADDLASTELQSDLIGALITEVLYRQCAIGYFNAYENDDVDTIEYLTERYQLCLKYGYDAFSSRSDGGWPLGLATAFFFPQDTLESEAWITWLGDREELLFEVPAEGVKPMPDEWIEYYETSSDSTDS